jgi:hypothetical protein
MTLGELHVFPLQLAKRSRFRLRARATGRVLGSIAYVTAAHRTLEARHPPNFLSGWRAAGALPVPASSVLRGVAGCFSISCRQINQ